MGTFILPVVSESPQPAGAGFRFGGDATEFVGNLQRPFDLVLRCVVGSLGAFGQITRSLEPERQLMFNPIGDVVYIPAAHCPNY